MQCLRIVMLKDATFEMYGILALYCRFDLNLVWKHHDVTAFVSIDKLKQLSCLDLVSKTDSSTISVVILICRVD